MTAEEEGGERRYWSTPSGGVYTTAITDGEGNVVEIHEHDEDGNVIGRVYADRPEATRILDPSGAAPE